jgi:hypothetical protein
MELYLHSPVLLYGVVRKEVKDAEPYSIIECGPVEGRIFHLSV